MDADYAHEANEQRSVSGGVVMCTGACVVSLYCSTQKSITMCTKGAEYVAMATGIRETVFMRYVWSLIFPDRNVGCTTVMNDNKGGYA